MTNKNDQIKPWIRELSKQSEFGEDERGCEYCSKEDAPVKKFDGYTSDKGPKSHGFACSTCRNKFEKFNK